MINIDKGKIIEYSYGFSLGAIWDNMSGELERKNVKNIFSEEMYFIRQNLFLEIL